MISINPMIFTKLRRPLRTALVKSEIRLRKRELDVANLRVEIISLLLLMNLNNSKKKKFFRIPLCFQNGDLTESCKVFFTL